MEHKHTVECCCDDVAMENVNLREAIRGEREKNGVLSIWLKEEGDKVAKLNLQNGQLRNELGRIATAAFEGKSDGVEYLQLIARAALKIGCAPDCCKKPAEVGLCCICECHEEEEQTLKRVASGQNCIDCGKPVTSGNICIPCVRVRYPSND